MGLELLIMGLWVLQVIAAVALAGYTAFYRRWFAAVGTLVGAAIGISPFIVMRGQGPGVWGAAVSITLSSTLALTAIYTVAMRWRALAATVLLLTIPLAYRALAYNRFPPSTNVLFGSLAFLGEMAFLLGPIVCSLVFREVLGWLDHIALKRRSL